MKKIFFAFLLISMSYPGFAQQAADEKGYLSLNVGAVMPLEAFKATSRQEVDAAYAKTGVGVSLDYTGFVHKYWGLSAILGWRFNPVNTEAMNVGYFGGDVSATSYRTAYFMGAIMFRYPINKLSFFARPQVGVGRSSSPELEYLDYTGAPDFKPETSSVALIFGGGVGARYQFSKFGAVIEISELYTKPEFEAYDYQRRIDKYKQPIQTLTFNAGVTYCW